MKSISNWSVWYKNKGHKVEPEITFNKQNVRTSSRVKYFSSRKSIFIAGAASTANEIGRML